MNKKKEIIYYFILGIIVLISFSFYSSMRYPLLSSDDALNILMAHNYKLPHDIYCWGQDRGGTIIPLISQVFIKAFHFSAITSISLSNYLLLIIGFICFSGLFKTNYFKILFAIIWFLPFQRFIELLRYPIGIEYSLIAFTILLIVKYENIGKGNYLKKNLILLSIVLIFIISIWVSDLAIVTIGVLLFVLQIDYFVRKKKIQFNKLAFIYFAIGIILWFILIFYAKSFSDVKVKNYLSINNLSEIKSSFMIIKDSFYNALSFKTKEIFVIIYFFSVLIFLLGFIIFIIKNKITNIIFSNKWVIFFLLDFIVVFLTFLVSSWVLANGVGRWYFVASYISLSLGLLLAVEQIQTSNIKIKVFKLGLIVIVFIGAISTVYYLKYICPGNLKPKVEIIREFEQLGEIGIIADYWNSYIVSCSNPEMIKATPHDKSWAVRNYEMVDDVFKQKNIYVIKDMWLDNFPDTLIQFGHVLVKDGIEFNLGNCCLSKYKKIK
jgi:hypothetical protein